MAFRYETEATGKAFLLPITAVLATEAKGGGTVFVFDKAESVVRQQAQTAKARFELRQQRLEQRHRARDQRRRQRLTATDPSRWQP